MTISKKIHNSLIIWLFLMLTSMVPYQAVDAGETVRKNKTEYNMPDCIIESDYGTINWTTGLIRAKGISKPVKKGSADIDEDEPIVESAIDNARGNLFEILKSIWLSGRSASEKGESLKQPDQIYIAKLRKKTVGVKKVHIHSIVEQKVELYLETSIYGYFLESVLPPEIGEVPDIELVEPENREEQRANDTVLEDNQFKADTISLTNRVQRYTGIVVDARSLGFKPVICPVIVSEQGQEIYSPLFISRKYAVERGICGYICSPDPEVISKRAGNNPVIIKALRKDADSNHSIVISMSDADRVQKIAERHIFMKGCGVVILVSP